jgi:hypothetical protein
MRLQIKDAGSWRNLVGFDADQQAAVLHAAAELLRSLEQPKTVMRVADGDIALLFCRAPEFTWNTK